MRTGQPYQTRLDPPPGPPLQANGAFMDYAAIADNPPSHIHLPRDQISTGNVELQLPDLSMAFPRSPFILRLGTTSTYRPGTWAKPCAKLVQALQYAVLALRVARTPCNTLHLLAV
jgi:hypothetical protein